MLPTSKYSTKVINLTNHNTRKQRNEPNHNLRQIHVTGTKHGKN